MSTNSDAIYVSQPGGEPEGPVTLEELRARKAKGALPEGSLVWCEGMKDSMPVDEFLTGIQGVSGGWGPVAAFRSCLKRYVQFSGRASRSEYWWYQLSLFLLLVIVSILSSLLFGSSQSPSVVPALLVGLVFLALCLPSLAVLIRRLHDAGFCGWWVLLNCVPYVGGLAVFVFTLLPSKGINKYGLGPAGPEA